MEDITNVSPEGRKKESPDTKHGKENKDDGEACEIDLLAFFRFDLGINCVINHGSPVYKELLLSSKSPKVRMHNFYSYNIIYKIII
jgi:hypothetical protein